MAAQFKDIRDRYGLVSIVLHWSTALVIIVMLALGNAIVAASGDRMHLLSLHTGLALLAYPVLALRIGWRLYSGHPDALPRQNGRLVILAKITHYIIVLLILLMLISGPLMAWSGSIPVRLFGWGGVPSPLSPSVEVFDLTRRLHAFGGTALLVLVIGHIVAALLHIMFKRDGTLDKILIPPRKIEEETEIDKAK